MMNISNQPTQLDLDSLYPSPLIRGTRISRMEEQGIAPFCLDAEASRSLGTDNIGLFIGGVRTFETLVDRIQQIDESDQGGHWIVVPSTRRCAAAIRQHQSDDDSVWFVSPDDVPDMWSQNQTTFCLLESLSTLSRMLRQDQKPIAGILLVDSQCIVHKARGWGKRSSPYQNDRPQHVVDFRASLSVGGWSPPLVVFTQRPAKSVNTIKLQRSYCLESLYFLDGKRIRCGRVPVPGNISAPEPRVEFAVA